MKNLQVLLLVLFSCVLLQGAAQPVIGSTEVVKANAGRSTNQFLVTPLSTNGSNVGNFGIQSNLYLQGGITAASPGASSQFSAADTGTVPTPARITAGYQFDNTTSGHMNGLITEILIYPFPLTDVNRALVETFLKNKYGL